jgi:hypothetical protein
VLEYQHLWAAGKSAVQGGKQRTLVMRRFEEGGVDPYTAQSTMGRKRPMTERIPEYWNVIMYDS